MRIAQDHTVEISLINADIDAFRNILSLAIRRLQSTPQVQLADSPHHTQDGIKGTDLLAVKNQITKLAEQLGLGKPDLEPAIPSQQATDAVNEDEDDGIPSELRELAEMLSAIPGVSVSVRKVLVG